MRSNYVPLIGQYDVFTAWHNRSNREPIALPPSVCMSFAQIQIRSVAGIYSVIVVIILGVTNWLVTVSGYRMKYLLINSPKHIAYRCLSI